MVPQDEIRQLEALRRDLLREYESVSPEVVNERFTAILSRYETAPIRTFVPVLARRQLREEMSHVG